MTDNNITEIELSEATDNIQSDTPVMQPKDISLIETLPVNLEVSIGNVEMTVKQLYQLKAGEVVKLDTEVNQPVKILFQKQLVAEGLLVAVDDHYGVEITNIAEMKL